MSFKKKTPIFVFSTLALFALAWIIYDIYAINEGGTEASISFMFYEWSYKYPVFNTILSGVVGFLGGHFFWRIRDTKTTLELSENSRK
jgi:hypothetical protein